MDRLVWCDEMEDRPFLTTDVIVHTKSFLAFKSFKAMLRIYDFLLVNIMFCTFCELDISRLCVTGALRWP